MNSAWYRLKYKTCSLCLRVALHSQGGYFATDDCFAIGGPSTRSASHLHISHEKARMSWECTGDFLENWKDFSREIFQCEDDNNTQTCPKIDAYIKRKVSRSLTFHIVSHISKIGKALDWYIFKVRDIPLIAKCRWQGFSQFRFLFLLLFCFVIWKILCATPNENR